VYLPKLTRRALIAGTSAAPLFVVASPGAPADETVLLCQRWQALRAEIERRQSRWSALESWLIHNHSWCDLSAEEQGGLPAAAELHEIDARLDELFDRLAALGEVLPSLPATNPTAIVAKLSVAAALIWPQDEPQAHQLIVASIREITAMTPAARSV
jgi:hypothetical protein